LEWLLWQNCGPSDPTVSVYSGSALQFTYAAPGEIMNQPSVMLPRYVPGIDAPKLMVSSSTTTSTQVFDMLSGDVDWFTPGIYILRRTEPGSSFYSRASLTADETEHTVYGMDYQPVGNYPKPAGLTASILDVSRRTFDDDSITVEVMLRIGTTLPYIEVRQPGNAALFTVDSAGSATLSRFEGLQNKLLARTNLQPIWTKVFDLGSQTPVAAVEPKQGFPLLVWPNPVADRLFLDPQTFPAGKADVRITDALGRVVWQQHVSAPEVLEVNTARWPAGMYVVQVVSGGKTSSRTVVKQ
jgi:hypothetical protein